MYQVFIPTKYIPTDKTFTISANETGDEIFIDLKQNGFIKSVFWAKVVAKVFSQINRTKFYRGDYQFDANYSTYKILYDITKRPISLAVLIPEGFTKIQIAERLAKYINHFDKKDFLLKAREGYLYPETYFFYNFSTNDEILKVFNDKFNKASFLKFGRVPTTNEVIIASMLEREARDPVDMKMISGIIHNRLSKGMALQIDATVLYGKGAWQNKVYFNDLKHESDYNTYTNVGLPIGPISNPGINALDAAIHPAKTIYLFYITGRDGKMYYAETNAEHENNIRKYLR